MRPRVLLALTFASPVLALFAACSAGDVSPPPPIGDGGSSVDGQNVTEGGTDDSSSGGTTQQGQIIDLSTKAPIAGAAMTLGATKVTTDASGKYKATVDPTKPFNMKIEKAGYYTLTEQETLVKVSIDLGKTSFLSEQTAALLLGTLSGYDPKLGVLSVAIENQGCADEGGATLQLLDGTTPLAGASLYYFQDGIPTPAQPSAQTGQFPHAVAYNVPVDKPITVTVKHPTCTMIPFPVDKKLDTGTVTYTSATIASSAGKATSFTRVFLK